MQLLTLFVTEVMQSAIRTSASLCEVKGVGMKPPQILTHVTLLQKNVEKQQRKKQL